MVLVEPKVVDSDHILNSWVQNNWEHLMGVFDGWIRTGFMRSCPRCCDSLFGVQCPLRDCVLYTVYARMLIADRHYVFRSYQRGHHELGSELPPNMPPIVNGRDPRPAC